MHTALDNSSSELADARARGNWSAVRATAERVIAREPAPAAEVFLALAQACWHLQLLDEADRAAGSAIATNPALSEALIIAAWVAVARSDGAKAVEYYRRLAELNPHTSRWQLKIVQLLNTMGYIDEAVREADTLYRRWPADRNAWSYFRNLGHESPLSRKLANASAQSGDACLEMFEAREKSAYQMLERAAPAEAQWRRPLVVAAPLLDVQVADVPGARSGVLVFTGALDGVSMPLSTFDRYMASLDVTTIYLKDFSRLFYLSGIKSLGANYYETISALRGLLARLNIMQLAVIGHCDGADAGISYGVDLGAHHIVSSGPVTHFIDAFRSHSRRAMMARRLAEMVTSDLMDLKLFLESRKSTAHIQVFYKEEDDLHRQRVARIARIPGVTLHALRGYPRDPPLLRLALASEDLSKELTNLLGLAVAPPVCAR